jgi:RNA-directed DNA polymerase
LEAGSRKPRKEVERSYTTNKDNADVNFFLVVIMLEEIFDYRNVQKALKQVISNRGAGGIDGMQTDELEDYFAKNWSSLKASILEGSYRPSPVRKVEIPKPKGGTRMLGIPTVIDRVLQQSISQWLTPQYEPEFSDNSYGYRESRNTHQAVQRAKDYLNEGKEWVVELDLEKFFDRVNHDKLMGLLAKRISDKRTLKLIRSYLNSGIMEDGIISWQEEGTPQGSPLSPLLSNAMLNELDQELHSRGHSFVRYADDISIYVGSQKSAQRVKESIAEYIEKELKLKVNKEKTKTCDPYQNTLLGFSFYRNKEKGWEIRIAPRTLKRIKEKLKAKTKRSDPSGTKGKIKKIEATIAGWVNHFKIAKAKDIMQRLDGMVRTRLRIGIWRQWKKPKTKVKHLSKLGAGKWESYRWGNSSLGSCRMAHSQVLQRTLTNEYFTRLGYMGFYNHYYWKTEHQLKLF